MYESLHVRVRAKQDEHAEHVWQPLCKIQERFVSHDLSDEYCMLVCSAFWKQCMQMSILSPIIDKLDPSALSSESHICLTCNSFNQALAVHCRIDLIIVQRVHFYFAFVTSLGPTIALGVPSVLLCTILAQPSKSPGQYSLRVSVVWLVFLAATWKAPGEKVAGSSLPQPRFTLISKWQIPYPHHQELDCEFMPMWFLCVCLSKLQIFIKTASMSELPCSVPKSKHAFHIQVWSQRNSVSKNDVLS